ncbi:endolytic transglycosylase MltG [Paracidovorax avenae]|nr:endolytic transglycosylase MltG [Paracidovorax avenae]
MNYHARLFPLSLFRFVRRFFLFIVLVAFAAAGLGFWWLHHPLPQRAAAGAATAGGTPGVLELEIEPGTTPRGVAVAAVEAGVDTDPRLLYAWFRLSGKDRLIKAGNYEIPPGTTPFGLLQKLVRGEEALRAVTLVEGWTFRQFRAALDRDEALRHDTQGLADAAIMERLGRAGVPPEGRFFPDTYTFAKGTSDLAVMRRALRAMDRRLEAAWAQRSADLPLKSADEALILASIVEKETGRASDRGQIAGVFVNRLRAGMMLQTDPTVIYGMGEKFDGNLRRRDLLADTPWNTYTRAGLPPTPISMPGKASLIAAVQPERTQALYFVARGDGTSHFSPTLDEHNRAVNRYQRGQPAPQGQ